MTCTHKNRIENRGKHIAQVNYISRASRVLVSLGLAMLAASTINAQEVVDQENDVTWQGAAVNIQPVNTVGQSFVPSCNNVVAVEIALSTINRGMGDDTVIVRLLRNGGTITQSSKFVIDGLKAGYAWI